MLILIFILAHCHTTVYIIKSSLKATSCNNYGTHQTYNLSFKPWVFVTYIATYSCFTENSCIRVHIQTYLVAKYIRPIDVIKLALEKIQRH